MDSKTPQVLQNSCAVRDRQWPVVKEQGRIQGGGGGVVGVATPPFALTS